MRRGFSLLAALGVLLSLGGCVPESVHPLSEPADSMPDPRLAGLWSGRMEEGTTFVHFLPREGAPTEVVMVNYDADGEGEWLAYTLFTSRVGDGRYMNVKPLAESGEAFDPEEENYILCRYEVAGDRLTVWVMAEEAVAADIRDGKVGGVVEEGRFVDTVRLTVATEGLRDYVSRSNPGRLFADRLATFERVR